MPQKERWMGDDKISILVCCFLYMSCEGENYYWPHGVSCSFFLIEKDLQLEDVSCAFCASMRTSMCILDHDMFY